MEYFSHTPLVQSSSPLAFWDFSPIDFGSAYYLLAVSHPRVTAIVISPPSLQERGFRDENCAPFRESVLLHKAPFVHGVAYTMPIAKLPGVAVITAQRPFLPQRATITRVQSPRREGKVPLSRGGGAAAAAASMTTLLHTHVGENCNMGDTRTWPDETRQRKSQLGTAPDVQLTSPAPPMGTLKTPPRQPQQNRAQRNYAINSTNEGHGSSHRRSPRPGHLPGPAPPRGDEAGASDGNHGWVLGFAGCGGSPIGIRAMLLHRPRGGCTKIYPLWVSIICSHVIHQFLVRTHPVRIPLS